jgi:hypothetical protein
MFTDITSFQTEIETMIKDDSGSESKTADAEKTLLDVPWFKSFQNELKKIMKYDADKQVKNFYDEVISN